MTWQTLFEVPEGATIVATIKLDEETAKRYVQPGDCEFAVGNQIISSAAAIVCRKERGLYGKNLGGMLGSMDVRNGGGKMYHIFFYELPKDYGNEPAFDAMVNAISGRISPYSARL